MQILDMLVRLREISPAIHYFTITAIEVAFFYGSYLLLKRFHVVIKSWLSHAVPSRKNSPDQTNDSTLG